MSVDSATVAVLSEMDIFTLKDLKKKNGTVRMISQQLDDGPNNSNRMVKCRISTLISLFF